MEQEEEVEEIEEKEKGKRCRKKEGGKTREKIRRRGVEEDTEEGLIKQKEIGEGNG